jgi:hypothetical protein
MRRMDGERGAAAGVTYAESFGRMATF